MNSRIRSPFYIFSLNPDYVAARSAAIRAKIIIGIHAKRRLRHPRVVRGVMHSGKKWRGVLWLNAVHSGKK